ncbi:MAG: hypothetical protein P9M14_02025, partial [Candidatus Alcyoniella australis]|nr:hypothetical protein [Candidatus Alcyoniella australis]
MSDKHNLKALDWLLLFLLAPAVYLIHLSLLWAVAILSNPRLIVAALIAPGIFLILAVWIRLRAPRAVWLIYVWSALYYLLCALFALAVLALTHTISPALSAAYVIYAVWAGWYVRRRNPGPLAWAAILLVPLAQFLWFDLRWALLLIPLIAAVLWIASRGVLRRLSAPAVSFCLLGLCLVSEGGVFYLRPSFFETFAAHDRAVTALAKGLDQQIPYTNLRFAVQSCSVDQYLVGGRGEQQALWLVGNGEARPIAALAGGEASDNAEPLCERGEVFVGDFGRGKLLGLDCYSGEVLGELEVHDVGRPLRRGLAPQSQSEDRPAMLT